MGLEAHLPEADSVLRTSSDQERYTGNGRPVSRDLATANGRVVPSTVRRVGILGLGYVGLPLAVACAESGLEVIGIDADATKVAEISSGISHVEDVAQDRLKACVRAERLRATTAYESLGSVDALLMCLPTPLNEHQAPDLSIVVEGAASAEKHLRPGTLIVLESTTYPGTTREVILPIFERNGYRVGTDFYLAFSPERIDPGNRTHTIRNTPKVVGGISPECTRRARELYDRITEQVHVVSSPESAELSKLLENIFRGVNIALVNELAILCSRMGIDVWEVVEAASTKPFGFMPFYPGPGLGGHCIPIDPFYLSWRARAYDTTTEFIDLAGRVNVNMPYYVANRVIHALNAEGKAAKRSRILILGMSYKPDIGDLRESPSLKILELLRSIEADVSYHDPYIPSLPEWGLASVELTEDELCASDCVIIATDHTAIDLQRVVRLAPKVMDLRNAVRRRLHNRSNGPLPTNVEVL